MQRYRLSWITKALTITVFVLSTASRVSAQPFTITEINPSQSSLHASDPDGASGGRVNGLARATNTIFFAASEWGGIYKSTDAGKTWSRLNTHLPTVTWDVEVSPSDANRVIATSFYDGRVNSLAGINISTDGGATWTHPASATPPAGFCVNAARHDEPSAYGIAFDPATPRNVYAGTNCGLAISNDSGATWRFIDPTPANLADDVWDVVVHHGGIIDACGNDGHRRSSDGGTTWTTATAAGIPLPGGRCSIAASPDEGHVLLAVVGVSIFESDNGGGTWNTTFVNPATQGRIPFVATNKRGGRNFDLWFGDVSLFRAGCTTPAAPAPGGAARCPASGTWAGGFTRSAGAHDDTGDIVFTKPATISNAQCLADCQQERSTCQTDCADEREACMAEVGKPGGPLASQCAKAFNQCRNSCTGRFNRCKAKCQVASEGCPILMSSDGGVYVNTRKESPACQTPAWTQPDVTPHGLWLFGMSGANRPADRIAEDVYFVNQDNGTFGTTNAGAEPPSWTNRDCCDGFDAVASAGRVVYTVCCFSPGRGNRIFMRGSGMTGGNEINAYPAGNVPGFAFVDVIDRFSSNGYVLITTAGVFITSDITASPIAWTQIGAATSPAGACGVQAAGSAANPVFFVQAGTCSGSAADTVWRYQGIAAGNVWQQINPPNAFGANPGFAVFTIDRNNTQRMFSALSTATGPHIVRSVDGGANWTGDAVLDGLMTGGGTYRYRTTRGPTNFTGFGAYAQPTLLAYDPNDANTFIAGGADSGIFLSHDGGANWITVTNNAGTAAQPYIPRPHFAYFDRECNEENIYVGTQGRGVWRIGYSVGTTTGTQCVAKCTAEAKTCRGDCADDRDACMADVGKPGGPLASQCAQAFVQCNRGCTNRLTQCRAKCGVCPSS